MPTSMNELANEHPGDHFYRPQGAPLSPRSQHWGALAEARIALAGVVTGVLGAVLLMWAIGGLN